MWLVWEKVKRFKHDNIKIMFIILIQNINISQGESVFRELVKNVEIKVGEWK